MMVAALGYDPQEGGLGSGGARRNYPPPQQKATAYTISCLKNYLFVPFFTLDSPWRGAYYAPQVEESGRKWAFLSILSPIIKVLLEVLSTPWLVPSAKALC